MGGNKKVSTRGDKTRLSYVTDGRQKRNKEIKQHQHEKRIDYFKKRAAKKKEAIEKLKKENPKASASDLLKMFKGTFEEE